jgi:hypothetical protein
MSMMSPDKQGTSMNEEITKKDLLALLKSGIGVGSITILGYVLAFLYEEGYTRYFKIPSELIKLDLINIFIFIFYLLSLIFTIYLIINTCYKYVCTRQSIVQRAFLRLVPYLLFFLAIQLITINTKTWKFINWIVAIAFLITIFNEFVLPIITQRGKGSYYQKLQLVEERHNKSNFREPNILDIMIPTKYISIYSKVLNVIFILGLFLMATNILGNANAERKEEFLVMRDSEHIAVLKIYGDKYICAPFDPNSKTFADSLYIFNFAKKDDLKLDWEKIGPLKPVTKQNK